MKLQRGILTILFGSALVLTGCKCERKGEYAQPLAETEATVPVAAETTGSKIDANGNYVYDVGNSIDISLPDGTKMTVGENSSENKLFGMLNNPDFKVSDDKTQGWVTLDRVYFETGKSDLTDASKQQLANIAMLMKAFPTAHAKIGGYTDNSGTEDINMSVSAGRAKTVSSALVADGIDGSRLADEGYGPHHFVCEANDTDECKAQNRRVDIRVTQK